jgi:hypothetical protein
MKAEKAGIVEPEELLRQRLDKYVSAAKNQQATTKERSETVFCAIHSEAV